MQYHARPAFAQEAYRDEAGIGGACASELLVQAWRVDTTAADNSQVISRCLAVRYDCTRR
jgi:hypothetical protein